MEKGVELKSNTPDQAEPRTKCIELANISTTPLKEEGYIVHKQCFFELIRILYGWKLDRLTSKCECGSTFSIDHTLSCKKGGFVSLTHNQARNLTAILLDEVCRDVCVESQLLQLTGENLNEKMAIRSDEARIDIAARNFWVTWQMAFFDVRVFNPIAKRYVHMDTSEACQLNEKEKKKNYNKRILKVEDGSFRPIVMSAYGGIGKEGNKLCNRLAELLAEKNKQLSVMTSWIRRKLIFALINSKCMCIRGSRRVFQTNFVGSVQSVDPVINEATSRI